MLIEQKCKLVIVLCSYKEKGLLSQERYWGKEGDLRIIGEMEVTTVSKEGDKSQGYRVIRIKIGRKTKPSITVTILKVYEWKDKDVMPSTSFYNLTQCFEVVHKTLQESYVPVVIHCKAGLGRSGVVASCYFLYEYLMVLRDIYQQQVLDSCLMRSKELGVSVFSTVRRLRENRWGLVMSSSQLRMTYELTNYMISNILLL